MGALLLMVMCSYHSICRRRQSLELPLSHEDSNLCRQMSAKSQKSHWSQKSSGGSTPVTPTSIFSGPTPITPMAVFSVPDSAQVLSDVNTPNHCDEDGTPRFCV